MSVIGSDEVVTERLIMGVFVWEAWGLLLCGVIYGQLETVQQRRVRGLLALSIGLGAQRLTPDAD
jgi:hypothetical protein